MNLLLGEGGGGSVWEEPMGSHRLTPNGETEAPSGENLCSWQNPAPESWLCFFHGASLPPVAEWVLKRRGQEQAGHVQSWMCGGGTCFPRFGAWPCFKWSHAGRWFPWPAALPAAEWALRVQGRGSNPGQTQVAGALLSLQGSGTPASLILSRFAVSFSNPRATCGQLA